MAIFIRYVWSSYIVIILFSSFNIIHLANIPVSNSEYLNYDALSTADKAEEIIKFVDKYATTKETVNGLQKYFPYVFNQFFDIFNFGKFFHHLREKASSAALCFSCKFVVSLLQHYVERGATENEIGAVADEICRVFRIETPRVCAGLSTLFKGEISEVLAKVALVPNEVCGIMLGDACGEVLNPLHNWTVTFPPFPKPPVKPIPPPEPHSPVLRVLQLSDTHVDPYYKEGSLANCKEPLCCHQASGTLRNASDAAGYWGDYRNCDTPLRTFENMLQHINKSHKVDYVIWTGDIPPHDIWNNSKEEVSYLIHETAKLMKKYLGSVPIFPALGNHESSPVNSFPIPEVKGNNSISWLYNELVNAWAPWLPADVASTLKIGAYYSLSIFPGFRLISINMNYCNNLNWWLLLNSTDPTDELKWLVNELQMAEIKGEKVHIIGHIPPGLRDCLKVWSYNYYRIINRYESTVVAQFFGHTHTDEYELFYEIDEKTSHKRATNVAYIGPSITTYFGLNPGYRIYTVDGYYHGSSMAVLNHETYVMNLTDANLTNKPKWKFEYSACESYNMTSLLPLDWDQLTSKFENNDAIFQKFYKHFTKFSDYHSKPCDGECKKDLLCRLRTGTTYKSTC